MPYSFSTGISSFTSIEDILRQSGVSSQIGGESAVFVNSIFSGVNDIEQITNGDASQKAAGYQNIIKKVMNMISSAVANNEAQNARSEDKKNQKKIEDWTKTSEKTDQEIKAGLKEVETEIDAQTAVVTQAQTVLTEAEQEIQEKQEEINEKIKEIQELQQQLLNADPKDRAAFLGQIQELSNGISATIATIADIQTKVSDASSEVVTASATIENARGRALEINQEGSQELAQLNGQAATLVETQVGVAQQGIQNKLTGEAAEKAAEAGSTNFVTGSTVAPKLYMVANDQKQASDIRGNGSVTNLTSVLQGIGGLNNSSTMLAEFNNSIGKAISAFDGCIGAWNYKLDGTITSLGSFSTVETQNSSLGDAVKEDLSNVDKAMDVGPQLPPEEADKPEESGENQYSLDEINGMKTPNVVIDQIEIKKPLQ